MASCRVQCSTQSVDNWTFKEGHNDTNDACHAWGDQNKVAHSYSLHCTSMLDIRVHGVWTTLACLQHLSIASMTIRQPMPMHLPCTHHVVMHPPCCLCHRLCNASMQEWTHAHVQWFTHLVHMHTRLLTSWRRSKYPDHRHVLNCCTLRVRETHINARYGRRHIVIDCCQSHRQRRGDRPRAAASAGRLLLHGFVSFAR